MKKITFTILSVLITCILFAQVPQAFKYQAVVRDSDGEILSNQLVSFQISILQGNASGTSVYSETHDTTTNEQGLVNLEIGNGTLVSGDFATINWGEDTYYLQVEMDETGNENYQLMGTSQLLHVPYAVNAKSLTLTSPNGTIFNITIDNEGNLGTCPAYITDYDGNIYNTILIGSQCWMVENLKTTNYSNGTPIPNVIGGYDWTILTTGAYVWYNNDISWKDHYGALYNWFVVADPNGICPLGWHVPDNSEWTVLTDYIGGVSSPNANKLKSCRQVNSPLGGDCNTSEHPRWDENATHYGTDDYCFSGLPAGLRDYGSDFFGVGWATTWWTSTDVSSTHGGARSMYSNYGNIWVWSDMKEVGYSVRCIKD